MKWAIISDAIYISDDEGMGVYIEYQRRCL